MSYDRDMHRSAYLAAVGDTVDFARARMTGGPISCEHCMFYDQPEAGRTFGHCFRYPGAPERMRVSRCCGEFLADSEEYFDLRNPPVDTE